MATVMVFVFIAAYFYAAGSLIRMASRAADRETPGWWEVVGMLLWPPCSGNIFKRLTPDAWGWPEKWIGGGIWFVVMLMILLFYFKLRVIDSVLITVGIFALAMIALLLALPYLSAAAT